MALSRRDKWARRFAHEFVSKHTRFRGPAASADGRTTLLSVNYNSEPEMLRLIRSFRKFCPGQAVHVVENGNHSGSVRAAADAYVRTPGNLHHGLGLDWGMRSVSTEWTLVCDPDAAVISADFLPTIRALADAGKGVAGIESAHTIYHPICLLFRTEFWKGGGFSFRERWPWFDVAGELTAIVGGRDPDTLLKRTKVAGPRFPAFPIYLIEVYEHVFTNTYVGARIRTDETDEWLGLPRDVVRPVHEAWSNWVDGVLAGTESPHELPLPEVEPDMRIGL
jgi:hypothetical protein